MGKDNRRNLKLSEKDFEKFNQLKEHRNESYGSVIRRLNREKENKCKEDPKLRGCKTFLKKRND